MPQFDPEPSPTPLASFSLDTTAIRTDQFGSQSELPATPRHRRVLLPSLLFLATCLSTYLAGGLAYAVPVMAILTAHEFGHYIQARRYGVPATWPLFIPFPFSPFGTMGAVIVQRAGWANRKALFDIAVSGPLAGLVLTIPVLIVGIQMSKVVSFEPNSKELSFGTPLLVEWLIELIHGPISEEQILMWHPVGFAGWVGIFITGLNLLPIGQLDGGHILYALLLRRANVVAWCLLRLAVLVVVAAGSFIDSSYFGWSVMLVLLVMMGARHPPTADDFVPLGLGRKVLGWMTLAFILIGFTPAPLTVVQPKKPQPIPHQMEHPELWVKVVEGQALRVE
jgi:membrane-associated protease RseP (regulator of RpoE activity)